MALFAAQYLGARAVDYLAKSLNTTSSTLDAMPLSSSKAYTYRSRRGKVKRARYGAKRVPRSLVRAVVDAAHERKTIALQSFATAVGTGSTFTLVNPLNQGTGATQRIGRDVVNDKINVRYAINGAAINTADMVRVLLVWDKETKGAAPVAADIFTNTTAGYMQVSSLNEDNLGNRFVVLMDNLHAIQPPTTTSYPFIGCVKSVKVNKTTHYYNTNVGTVTDIDSGSIYLVYTSYLGGCNIIYDIQTVYKDR